MRFPLPLPDVLTANIHLILVTHGASAACQRILGGSGSFILRSDIRGPSASDPFTIGDLNPNGTYIHVLDDTSLEILLRTRDTVADFTEYLLKKERFLRSGRAIWAAGEEELLALYLKSGTGQQHEFVVPPEVTGGVAVPEGHWLAFSLSPQRGAQREHDQISYSWDKLIDKFNYHAMNDDQYPPLRSEGGIERTETLVRFMAREPRTRRRMLAHALNELVHVTPVGMRAVRVIAPSRDGDPYYVFLVMTSAEMSEADYRTFRAGFLDAAVRVTKLKFPNAVDIIGIATEAGAHVDPRTEDAMYLNARDWCEDLQKDAVECQQTFGLLTNVNEWRTVVDEFPTTTVDGELIVPPGKNPRNKPCPCNSGRKFKKCHGA